MATILALDASTERCSVALLAKGAVTESVSDVPRAHADLLLPMVHDLLSQHELALGDVDAVAFGAGPGSFTGLRICLGTVQGLAFGADLPLVPVSSLQAMALQAFEKWPGADACAPAIDARMGEVYWAVYRNTADVVEISPPSVSSVADADTALGSRLTRTSEVTGVGSGWSLLVDSAPRLLHQEALWWPTAAAVAKLGALNWELGRYTDAMHAEPVYLRNEITWEKRTRVRR